ncbi:MAG TPA: sulfocyanin-like copper-binding protein [Acidimicrobiales bacterium]|nr:sulfocyanin-like copper-binding protein [Acidimicrobiales bacterium]
MSVDEQSLAQQEAERKPAHLRSPVQRDTVSVVAVLVASLAMIAALVAVGFAARAVNTSNKRLKQITAGATATTAAPAPAPAAPAAVAPAAATASTLGVTLHDFAVTPDVQSVPAGLVTLKVTDRGPTAHELLIFQTDLAPDKLPLGTDGRVDEEGDGVQKVFDSGDNIDVGKTKTFNIALAAGNYVMICNLPGHYKLGMHTAFKVTPSAAPVFSLGVTQKDFSLTPVATSLPAGLVDLNVTDQGPTPHELLIFQTDLAPDKLPLGPDGRVDEGGDGITKVFDSGDNVAVGTTKLFHTALSAGNYVLVCNLPGHYKAGMHTAFTVTGTPVDGGTVPAS